MLARKAPTGPSSSSRIIQETAVVSVMKQRSATRQDALHAGVPGAQFLAEAGQLVLHADGGGDATGDRDQGDSGQGEGVEDRGASLPRLAEGHAKSL